MGRLLIDYSKNTAPLQPSGEDQELGMSLKYHVPDEEMSSSLKSLSELNFNPPRSPRPPQGGTAKNGVRAIYPLQQASVFDSRKMPGPDFQEQNSKSKKAQRNLSPRRQRTHENATTASMITFRLPKTSRIITTKRKGKLHYSDSDLFGWADRDVNDNMSTSNQTTQTTPAKRTTNKSKDDASLSVCTAPAKVSSAKLNRMNGNRNSISESIKEEQKDEIDKLLEEESDHEEEEPQSSFLPSKLSRGKDRSPSPHPADKKKKKGKKKKNKTTLDEWFGKGGREEEKEDREEPTKDAAKKKAEAEDVSIALSQMSESYPMGPEARKRMLPKRSLSFDVDRSAQGSHRSLVSASTNTRRGGRKPANRSKSNEDDAATVETNATSSRRLAPRRGVARTRSFDGSVTPMSSSRGDLMRNNNSSYSFMAGSRIRVRTLGGGGGSIDSSSRSLLGSTSKSNSSKGLLGSMSHSNDDESVVSQTSSSTASPRRRRLPGRSRTCESLTRMRV